MSHQIHTGRTKARVIELHQSGWKPAEIRDVLRREGYAPIPARNTIWAWTNPEKADAGDRRRIRRYREQRVERASFQWPGVRTSLWKFGRMKALRGLGVSYADIARVMYLDFGDDFTEAQIRKAFEADRYPTQARRSRGRS